MAIAAGDRTPKTPEERGFQIIDIHAHPFIRGGYPPAMKAMLASRKYTQPNWRGKSGNATLEDLKAEFDETGPEVMANDAKSHGVKMQPVAWDATSGMGEPPTSNEFVYATPSYVDANTLAVAVSMRGTAETIDIDVEDENGTLAVRERSKGDMGTMTFEEFLAQTKTEFNPL